LRQQQSLLTGAAGDHGLAIVVVTFEQSAIARSYVERTDLPWPVLVDRERTLYRAYDMDRAPRRVIWGWRSWRAYARLIRRGRRLQRATGDTRQRGGDVLIDPDGIVRLHHVGHNPADRPPVERIRAAMVATRHR
jgi:hypothetical protein